MDAKEREKLEKACDVCRKAGIDGKQLLLVRLEDVEEYLRLEAMTRDILHVMGELDRMRQILRAEFTGGENGTEANTGEEPGTDGSSPKK